MGALAAFLVWCAKVKNPAVSAWDLEEGRGAQGTTRRQPALPYATNHTLFAF